jgi:DNA ligase-1
VKPLLAHTYSPHRIIYPTLIQPKLNGVRALYQAGYFQSRDELPWNHIIVEHLAAPLKYIFNDDVILDGEFYVHGWPLQRINGAIAVNRQAPCDDTSLVEFHVFDVVNFSKPFHDRFDPVAEILAQTRAQHAVRPVPVRKVFDESQANDEYARWVTEGYEGIMYRLGACNYTRPSAGRGISDKNNRSWSLLKRKDFQDAEFLINGVEEGLGKRRNMAGALVCETPEGREFRVGTGFTELEAISYYENPPTGKTAKVKYLCLTHDKIPFNPTLLFIY